MVDARARRIEHADSEVQSLGSDHPITGGARRGREEASEVGCPAREEPAREEDASQTQAAEEDLARQVGRVRCASAWRMPLCSPISATTCRCRATWPSKTSEREADVLMPTPADLEAATKLMVKEAIHAGAGDCDPGADVAFWRKGDTDPSLIVDRWSEGRKSPARHPQPATRNSPFPRERTSRMGYPMTPSTPHSHRARTTHGAQQPNPKSAGSQGSCPQPPYLMRPLAQIGRAEPELRPRARACADAAT